MGDLRRDQSGFSAPLMVLILAVMVLLIGGISIDLWRVIAEHREVSGLVDGAAIAGATGVDIAAFEADPTADPVLDPVVATRRACQYMTERANVLSCPSATLSVTIGPDARSIQVGFSRQVDLTLLAAIDVAGTEPITVYADAIAGLQRGTP